MFICPLFAFLSILHINCISGALLPNIDDFSLDSFHFELPLKAFDFGLDIYSKGRYPSSKVQVGSTDSFSLNSDLTQHIMEFLYSKDCRNTIEIFSFLKVSKSFYSTGIKYMDKCLRAILTDGKADPSIKTALFVIFSDADFNSILRPILYREIRLNDLVEIIMSRVFRIRKPPVLAALVHLFKTLTHPSSPTYDHLLYFSGMDWSNWILKSFDRTFLFDFLPVSLDAYLNSGIITPVQYFQGICSCKDELSKIEIFLQRASLLPSSSLSEAQKIQISCKSGNIVILEHLIPSMSAQCFDDRDNNFLELLIRKKMFSFSLFIASSGNSFAMERALQALYDMNNLEMFLFVLKSLNLSFFPNNKWLGCFYLLSRRNDPSSFFDLKYFQDTFLADFDNSLHVYPNLMPNFNLSDPIFKDIFKKLVSLPQYSYSSAQNEKISLIVHCIKSSEDYLNLLPPFAHHAYIGLGGKSLCISENVHFQKEHRNILLANTRNPLNLLYYLEYFSDIDNVLPNFSRFDINAIFLISVSQIALSISLPPPLYQLFPQTEWNLLGLAILFEKHLLIKLIIECASFDARHLDFRIADSFTLIEIAQNIIQYFGESPYDYLRAHEMQNSLDFILKLIRHK
jgi:hypothetical protein